MIQVSFPCFHNPVDHLRPSIFYFETWKYLETMKLDTQVGSSDGALASTSSGRATDTDQQDELSRWNSSSVLNVGYTLEWQGNTCRFCPHFKIAPSDQKWGRRWVGAILNVYTLIHPDNESHLQPQKPLWRSGSLIPSTKINNTYQII